MYKRRAHSFSWGSFTECVCVSLSVISRNNRPVYLQMMKYEDVRLKFPCFYVFLTVHHSIDLFQVTNLTHTSFIL